MPNDNDFDFNNDPPSDQPRRDEPRRDRDDRPRRDRRDDHDDRPRRDRYDERPQPSVLGVLSLVQGVGSLVTSFIPCVGALAIIGGALGLLLGVIGVIVARGSNGRQGSGLPIAGTAVSALAILIGGFWLLFMGELFKKADEIVREPGPGVEITAVALDKEFEANELDADRKYKFKLLIVTGAVKKITRDDKPGKITVELTGTPGSTVDCHFDRSKQPELDALAVGQEVTVRGTCKGKVRTWVTLDDCSLTAKPAAKPEPKDATPPIAITADELEKAYDANVVAADAAYKNKPLELTGRVGKVGQFKKGVVTLEIETEAGDTIDCDFAAAEQAALKDVAKGDVVVIRGTCRGHSEDDGVTLRDCSLVKKADKPADGPPVAVTAAQLAKDYEDNVVAADKKYKGKVLEVSGAVQRVGKLRPNTFSVELGSDDRVLAVCEFAPKDGAAQLADVAKGDAVVIRGTLRSGDGVPLLENCSLVKK